MVGRSRAAAPRSRQRGSSRVLAIRGRWLAPCEVARPGTILRGRRTKDRHPFAGLGRTSGLAPVGREHGRDVLRRTRGRGAVGRSTRRSERCPRRLRRREAPDDRGGRRGPHHALRVGWLRVRRLSRSPPPARTRRCPEPRIRRGRGQNRRTCGALPACGPRHSLASLLPGPIGCPDALFRFRHHRHGAARVSRPPAGRGNHQPHPRCIRSDQRLGDQRCGSGGVLLSETSGRFSVP